MNSESSNMQFIESGSSSNSMFSSAIEQIKVSQKTSRVLRWFKKEDDHFVGEITIDNVSLKRLQQLFGISADNPMYDCYLVESPEQINYLQKILNVELDLKSYEYFVECDQV